tara:strand:- start:4277 stop:7993 length:3717 start_codon:yes stop_codon:yes gene_type:complete
MAYKPTQGPQVTLQPTGTTDLSGFGSFANAIFQAGNTFGNIAVNMAQEQNRNAQNAEAFQAKILANDVVDQNGNLITTKETQQIADNFIYSNSAKIYRETADLSVTKFVSTKVANDLDLLLQEYPRGGEEYENKKDALLSKARNSVEGNVNATNLLETDLQTIGNKADNIIQKNELIHAWEKRKLGDVETVNHLVSDLTDTIANHYSDIKGADVLSNENVKETYENILNIINGLSANPNLKAEELNALQKVVLDAIGTGIIHGEINKIRMDHPNEAMFQRVSTKFLNELRDGDFKNINGVFKDLGANLQINQDQMLKIAENYVKNHRAQFERERTQIDRVSKENGDELLYKITVGESIFPSIKELQEDSVFQSLEYKDKNRIINSVNELNSKIAKANQKVSKERLENSVVDYIASASNNETFTKNLGFNEFGEEIETQYTPNKSYAFLKEAYKNGMFEGNDTLKAKVLKAISTYKNKISEQYLEDFGLLMTEYGNTQDPQIMQNIKKLVDEVKSDKYPIKNKQKKAILSEYNQSLTGIINSEIETKLQQIAAGDKITSITPDGDEFPAITFLIPGVGNLSIDQMKEYIQGGGLGTTPDMLSKINKAYRTGMLKRSRTNINLIVNGIKGTYDPTNIEVLYDTHNPNDFQRDKEILLESLSRQPKGNEEAFEKVKTDVNALQQKYKKAWNKEHLIRQRIRIGNEQYQSGSPITPENKAVIQERAYKNYAFDINSRDSVGQLIGTATQTGVLDSGFMDAFKNAIHTQNVENVNKLLTIMTTIVENTRQITGIYATQVPGQRNLNAETYWAKSLGEIDNKTKAFITAMYAGENKEIALKRINEGDGKSINARIKGIPSTAYPNKSIADLNNVELANEALQLIGSARKLGGELNWLGAFINVITNSEVPMPESVVNLTQQMFPAGDIMGDYNYIMDVLLQEDLAEIIGAELRSELSNVQYNVADNNQILYAIMDVMQNHVGAIAIETHYNRPEGMFGIEEFMVGQGTVPNIPYATSWMFPEQQRRIVYNPISNNMVTNYGLPAALKDNWKTFVHNDLKRIIENLPESYWATPNVGNKQQLIRAIDNDMVIFDYNKEFLSNNQKPSYVVSFMDPDSRTVSQFTFGYSYDYYGANMHNELVDYIGQTMPGVDVEILGKKITTLNSNNSFLGPWAMNKGIMQALNTGWNVESQSFGNAVAKINAASKAAGLNTVTFDAEEIKAINSYIQNRPSHNKLLSFAKRQIN